MLLALPLCHSCSHSPRCLLRLMSFVPWILHRWVIFFRIEPSTDFFMFMFGTMFAFRFQCGCHIYLWGLSHKGLQHHNTVEYTHVKHACHSLLFCVLNQGLHWVASPFTASSRRKPHATQLSFSHSINIVGHIDMGTHQKVTQSLCFLHMAGMELLFQVWFHPVTHLTPNLWLVLNLVIMVWWLGIRLVNLLTPGHWSIVLLITSSPWVYRQGSVLTHFQLEPGCEDYSFVDQAVAHFEQGMDSILTNCQNTGTGCILWWAWYNDIFSIVRVLALGLYHFWWF